MKPYYSEAGIMIYHGDCREVLPQLSRPLDLVLTDPPYAHEHMDGGGFAGHAFYSEGKIKGMSDFRLRDYAIELTDAAPMLIAFHSRDLICDYATLAKNLDRKYDLHVWYKANAIPFTANTWKSDLEYIALIWESKPGWVQHAQSLHSKAWLSQINCDPLHPTAKPMPLLSKYISILDAQTICDPFMGSGTSLRAAKDLGRQAIGIEIEEKYCEIAANRLRQSVMQFGAK